MLLGCGKTRLACHSEESAILIGGRRGISHCLENTQGEIPRSARNDSLEGFFRTLLGAGEQRKAVQSAPQRHLYEGNHVRWAGDEAPHDSHPGA